jgi:putative membrane protein
MKLLLRWAITAAALYAAAYLIDGIRVEGAWTAYFVIAVIFGLINALFRPVMKLLSLPLVLLTLGLFALVINAVGFWLSSYVAVNFFDIPFYVDGFVPAFLGALIVSIVSAVLNNILLDED